MRGLLKISFLLLSAVVLQLFVIVATSETFLNSSSKDAANLLRIKKSNDGDDDYDDDDNDNDYNDYTDDTERAKHTHQRNLNIINRIGVTFIWGKWEKWSKCTNSCVQIRRRKCIERIQNDTTTDPIENAFYPDLSMYTGCFGILKRYRHCKDEKCKSSNKKQRDEQCGNFNKIPYKGKFHNWLGYEKEHNECELFCRPSGSDLFISMNQSVTDGTPCGKPAVYYTHAYRRKAVCVEGICRAVHFSGAIRPATTNDSQTKCGSVLCQIVSEIYSKAKLSYGYNYITTIPAGAMNLTIKQMSHSDNLLALKTTSDTYFLNGNNRASESGIYKYDDDDYDYSRELGIITAKGPLMKPVELLLNARGLNTGIKYDYTIPVPSAAVTEEEDAQMQWNELGQPLDETEDNNIDQGAITRAKERKRRKFSWKLLGFGQCNRSCGPGIQQPIFRCIRDSPTRYYSPKRCAFMEKPVFSEDIYHCNRGLCPAYWRAGSYGECKCLTGSGEGARKRFVNCVQEQMSGKIEQVAESLCEQEKLPLLMETCHCPLNSRHKIYDYGGERTNHKVYARLLSPPTLVRVIHNSSSPVRRLSRNNRDDKSGVWLMSPWNEECSAHCGGAGFEHRSIYCDRTAPFTDLCDSRSTPKQKRVCSEREPDCAGIWFTSDWSNCTGDCLNLQRKRTVICVRDGLAVDESECIGVDKPVELRNCTHKDVDFCGAKWHYSEWSECSRSCGEGVQRRYAKCLEFDWKNEVMIESNNCRQRDREPVYGACNVQQCEELNTLADKLLGSVEAAADNCTDEFTSCKRINRQRLCEMNYYKTYCCATCKNY